MADKYIISKSKLTAIADAIRTKTGETGTLTADQMAKKITNIQTGDTALTKMLLSGSGGMGAVDTTSLNLTSYRDYAFYGIYGINSIKDDNITYIGSCAFSDCGGLGKIDFPKVQTVSNYAFSSCVLLKTFSIPLCSSVGNYAFYDIAIENAAIGTNATSPIYIKQGAFETTRGTSNSTTITIGGESEAGYVTLESGWVDAKTECVIYNCYMFYGSDSVTAFIFPKLHSTYGVPVYYGSVYKAPWYYFPAESVDQAKAATNWATVAGRIRPLEDLTLNRLTITGRAPNTEKTSATYKLLYNDGCYIRGTYRGVTWSTSSNVTIKASGDDSCTIEWENLKEGDVVMITATSTVNPAITTTQTLTAKTIKQSIKVDTTQWVETGETPTGALTEIWKSDAGSYHVSNGASLAKVTFTGYTKLTVSVRSWAESNYDFVTVSPLDFAGEFTRSSNQYVTSTKGSQSETFNTDSPFLNHDYTFEAEDGGEHFFYVLYSKDGSGDDNDDRGYFYIKSGE